MKKTVTAAIFGSLLILSVAQAAETAPQAITPERMTIFQVSLKCPAAPQIGCGSSAKPILLQLEHDPAVQEAWLNRTGTLIAVVWKSEPTAEGCPALAARLQTAGCCSKEQGGAEVQGAAREAALKEFQSGHGWYRGSEVDRLSEKEAGVIAARVVRRVDAKTPLAAEKAHGLETALREALSKRLTKGDDGNYEPEFRRISAQFLNEKQTAALKEAIESGLRPRADEK
jgi:hypothetical protein